jgi:integrase
MMDQRYALTVEVADRQRPQVENAFKAIRRRWPIQVATTTFPNVVNSPFPSSCTLPPEAESLRHRRERMARARYQHPKPFVRGKWWVLQIRRDRFNGAEYVRENQRIKLAPADTPVRVAQKLADEYLYPLNQGQATIGSATNFRHFVEQIYNRVVLPKKAVPTQGRSAGVIRNYLLPAFGDVALRDVTMLAVEEYLGGLAKAGKLKPESREKIKGVLSAVMQAAVRHDLLARNPVRGIEREKRQRRTKPHITPEQFERLLTIIREPYRTMVYVAVMTGLRVSELAGLRWNDIHADSITIDERYCRGDWDEPKTCDSNATISVDPSVIQRILRMKDLTVNVRAGWSVRRYKIVKADGPTDLVFQGVHTGQPMRDGNILRRHLKPAGKAIGIPWINWRVLRTSYATWLGESGASVKDVMAQMRHARIATTMEVYVQPVPESQRRAVGKLAEMVAQRRISGSNWQQMSAPETVQ